MDGPQRRRARAHLTLGLHIFAKRIIAPPYEGGQGVKPYGRRSSQTHALPRFHELSRSITSLPDLKTPYPLRKGGAHVAALLCPAHLGLMRSNFHRIRHSYIDADLYRRYTMQMNRLDQAFAALADPTRRGIVVHLARGEASVSDLVGLFSLTQPTISSHLKVLESAGLISRSRVAQLRPCKLETEQLKAVTDWLEKVQEIWEGNYKRLDALLAEMKQAQKEERKK